MTRGRDTCEPGTRVVATRTSANFFHKGQPGTVVESARDGICRVYFDNGDAWWLHESEFKREPRRRRRVSVFERVATAWVALRRGARP